MPENTHASPEPSMSAVAVSPAQVKDILLQLADHHAARPCELSGCSSEQTAFALRYAAQELDSRCPTLLFLLPAVSFLLAAAHFLRWGNLIAVLFCLAAPILMLIRHQKVRKLTQLCLALITILWLQTALQIYETRAMMGMPRMRMALILGLVASFTLFSALIMRNHRIVSWYD